MKQIRLVHKGKSFTKEELERFRDSLIDNVVDCCKSFTAATVRFGLEWDDEEDKETAEMFLDIGDEQVKLEQVHELHLHHHPLFTSRTASISGT